MLIMCVFQAFGILRDLNVSHFKMYGGIHKGVKRVYCHSYCFMNTAHCVCSERLALVFTTTIPRLDPVIT